MSETQPPIKVHHHNDYRISFYAGRDQCARHLKERNWVDDPALKLGPAMYAINSGKEAIVYDTFTSVAHAEFVRLYLEKLGARKFTAVLSHWHLDHIAGSAVFDDCDIIATSLTHDTLKRHTADIEAGTVWGRRPSRRSYSPTSCSTTTWSSAWERSHSTSGCRQNPSQSWRPGHHQERGIR
ncbi:MAG TPA: MBL fold metallo-hydrolase [Methyloceanibacter sp.]|nr:MBL fold metallo-hydrolase [Methyloceanibacter sp.]